jgi:lactoylglutathione lyase
LEVVQIRGDFQSPRFIYEITVHKDLTMRIDHLAIWTHNLETLRKFYETYFDAEAGEKYINPAKQIEMYEMVFPDGGRLDLMQNPLVPETQNDFLEQSTGLIHFAIGVGSEEIASDLISRLRMNGIRIVSEPRRTGKGYYECFLLDPDGNRVEITI